MENKFNGETVLLCRVQHYFCVALFLQRRGLTPQLHRIVSSGLLQTSQSIGHASLVNLEINQKSMWIRIRSKSTIFNHEQEHQHCIFPSSLLRICGWVFLTTQNHHFSFPAQNLTTLLMQASQFFTNWTKLEERGKSVSIANFIIQLF